MEKKCPWMADYYNTLEAFNTNYNIFRNAEILKNDLS